VTYDLHMNNDEFRRNETWSHAGFRGVGVVGVVGVVGRRIQEAKGLASCFEPEFRRSEARADARDLQDLPFGNV
jgi:hypothetical protein